MHPYIKPLAEKLAAVGDAETAAWGKSYMKDRFEFFGIRAPALRGIFKEFWAEHSLPPHGGLEPIVIELFELPEREFQYFAIELTGKFKKEFARDSLALFEKVVLAKSWWDSVDYIKSVCLRPYFLRFPEERYEITERWIDSGNIWLQRLSVIYQLGFRERTDIALLFRNIRQLTGSKEFFVQKGIGWALRELAKTEPETVKEFVAETELKPLSRREALKNIGR